MTGAPAMSINKELLGLDSQDTRKSATSKDRLTLIAVVPVVSISASQSLNASAAARAPISTGLTRLDEALDDLDQGCAGILRGQVAEVFGPPGAGKTSFA